MPSVILDAYARPATYTPSHGAGLYVGVDGDSRTRPSHPDMFADFARLLPRVSWKRAVSDCRWIETAFPLVLGASVQKADYASAAGWRTYYRGRDAAWGDYVEEFLADQVDPICTTRSPLFDWRSLWWSGSIIHDTDGAFFVNLTETENGFPKLQPIEAHRIGSWECLDSTVRGGTYDGARITNGIIYDREGNEIAYRVLESDNAYDLSQYRDISARDMVHVPGRVLFFSENRPLPRIAPALVDLYMAQDTRASEQISQNVNSRITLLEHNETGKKSSGPALTGNEPPRTPAGTDTEVIEKGFFRYIKNGGNLKAHESSRPSDQWQRFDDKITATALFAMGWRIEMFDLAKLGSAAIHGFGDQINTSIINTVEAQARAVLRCRRYQVSKLNKRSDIPPVPSDWWKWGLQQPPEFTGNQSRAVQADLDAVRAGAASMPDLHRRWGKRSRDVAREQAEWLTIRDAEAKRVGKDPKEIGRLDLPGDNETTKNLVDSVGAAVRAGTVTPTIEVEERTRALLQLPPMGEAAKAAWAEDGVRRPTTIGETEATAEPAQKSKPAPAAPPAP